MPALSDSQNLLRQCSVRTNYYLLNLLAGPLAFTFLFLLLSSESFSYEARGAIGILAWMATWWVLRPIHIGVTSLLPIVLNAFFRFTPMESILINYASPIVILLLGANIITVSWSSCGLDKRIAMRALCFIGPSIRRQIVIWFSISVVLTIFLPNVVVAAVLVPIAVAMLAYIGLGDNIGGSKTATVILLAIVWGAGLGGFGSPLGGAMNLVSIQHLEEMVLHREYMYITWTLRMLPMLALLSVIVIAYLIRLEVDTDTLPGSRQFFLDAYRKLPPMTTAEKWSLTLFVSASLLSFLRPFYADVFPELKPPYIFLLFGLLTFIVPGGEEKRLATWKYTGPRLMWGLFYLFAGGMAIGKFLTTSGAGNMLTEMLAVHYQSGGIPTIAIFVFMGILLSNVSSDTAACAILVPIVINMMQTLGLNPVPYVYIASVASNCAFILPTSVRAIPVGYGLDPKEMLKKGMFVLLMSLIAVTLFGYFCLKYWPGFSVA